MSGWSTPRPGRFTPPPPPRKTRYPLYRRLGGPQGRSGRMRKISPPTGIRSTDRPARTESLYRLSYPGPFIPAKYKTYLSVFSRSKESKVSNKHVRFGECTSNVFTNTLEHNTLRIREIQCKYVSTIRTSDQGLRTITLPQGHYPMQGHPDTTT